MSRELVRYTFRIIKTRGSVVAESARALTGIGEAMPHAASLALAWAKVSPDYHGGYVQVFAESGEEIARLPIVPPTG